MNVNTKNWRTAKWCLLFVLVWLTAGAVGTANAAPPVITIDNPPDGDTTSNPYMDLEVSVSADTYPVTLKIFGDTVSSPAELLYVQEGIGGPTSVPFTWDAPTLRAGTNTIGLWHLDDNSGTTATDNSSHGNDGTLINGAQWDENGKFGYAVSLNGTNDYIKIPDTDNSMDIDPTTGALTIEAWINPSTLANNIYRAFVSKRDSAVATAVNYSAYLNSTDGAITFYNGTFPSGFYISSIIPALNTWTYIAISIDASDSVMRFYRNGQLEDSVTGAYIGPVNDGPLTLGTSQTPSGNRSFAGLLDEVRVSSYKMSDDEIEANYNLGRDYYSWSAAATDASMQTTTSAEQHATIGLKIDPLSNETIAEGGTLVVDVTAGNPDGEPITLGMTTLTNGSFVDHGDGTGTLTFMPDLNQAGDYTVTFDADDGIEAVTRDLDITVTNTNQPPVVSDIPDQSTSEGGTFTNIDLTAYFSDPDVPDFDTLSYSATGAVNLDVSIVNDVATITILDSDWYGQETITFRATDNGGLFDEDDVVFTVTNVNDAPVVSDILDQEIDEGDSFATIALDDYVNDIDNLDSEINWTYSGNNELSVAIDGSHIATISIPNADWNGSETITFTATDPGSLSDSNDATFTVDAVNDAPVVADIPGETLPEGSSFATIDLDNYVSDVDNLPAEIDWSYSGNVDLSVSIDGDHVATITPPDADWFGSETITFTATDPGSLFDDDQATFVMTGVNDAPTIDDVADAAFFICNEISLAISAGDIDGVVTGIVASASPSGDLPDGASFTDNGDGTALFTWTPDNSQVGTYPLRFTVTDDSGATAYDDATITVNDDVTDPNVTLTSPADQSETSDQTMLLETSLSDDGPLTVQVYGGRDPGDMFLLDVTGDVAASTYSYDWVNPLMLADPLSTMGLWRFDENGTVVMNTIYDESGHGNDGIVAGWEPFWSADGKFGYALDLNGTNNFVLIDDDPSLDIDSATGALTIEAWIYPDAGVASWRGIIAKRGYHDNAGPCNYQLSLDPDNHLVFYSRGASESWEQLTISSVVVPADEWSYVAFTLDASEGKGRFYLNGAPGDEVDDVVFGAMHDEELSIGIAAREVECFDGLIDQVRLSSRRMDDNEIMRNYSQLGGGTFYWKVKAADCAGNEMTAGPWQFTITDNLAPRIAGLYPANGATAIYSFMDIIFDAWDESRMTLYIYGDVTPSASDLLYVADNLYSTSVDYIWDAAVFEPEPPYTAGLWHFDDYGLGTISDESFNDNAGSTSGNPQWTLDGRFGYALEFDGVNDYVDIPDDNSLDVDSATGTLTLEAWIRPDTIGGGIYHSFLSKRGSGSGSPDSVNYSLYLDEADGALTFYSGDFPNRYYISNVIPPSHEWSYLAVTLDAAEGMLRFYRNGVLEDSIPGAAFGPANDKHLTIGASHTTTQWRYFDGTIDEVRITKRVLSDEEIEDNFALHKSTYYWRVYAVDEFGNVNESETRYFTTNLFVCGDANGDSRINIGDAVYMINYVFKEGAAPDPIEAGDANCDGGSNVGDAVYLINFIFKGGPAPCCP